ncbi:hypothetical protein EBT31_18885, partial [bacterium]|nr:hypothetical protein [bacterium]
LHAKVYAGSWKNPLFVDPKVQERSSDRMRYIAYSLLVATSCIAFFSGLFWLGTQQRFVINDVQVEGMRSMPNKKIALHILQTSLNCKHFFAPCLYTWNISQANISEVLRSTYSLEQVTSSIREHLFFVQLREAVTMIPVRIGTQVWFATPSGVLQVPATADDIATGIIIPADAYIEIDVSAIVEGGAVGMQIADPHAFRLIAEYKKAFLARGISVASFAFTDDAGKVIAYTQAGFAVYFTPWEDADTQVRRLVNVLTQATPQAYADIRFGERIYIK